MFPDRVILVGRSEKMTALTHTRVVVDRSTTVNISKVMIRSDLALILLKVYLAY